jgi:hypothetical protein
MKTLSIIATLLLAGMYSFAQNPKADPQKAGRYLNQISTHFENIRNQSLSYQSAAAHVKRKRKVNKERNELNKALLDAKKEIAKIDCYEGNCILRDTVLYCLDLSYKMYKEEYDKIVDMEEIAEQSYDAMEAYMKAQEAADEKVDKSYKIYNKFVEEFCKQNNITNCF